MVRRARLRGHKIISRNLTDDWFYEDDRTPTIDNERPCGHCGKENTPEDHDHCVANLKGVKNACCGHGIDEEAYIQFWDDTTIRGIEATKLFNKLR